VCVWLGGWIGEWDEEDGRRGVRGEGEKKLLSRKLGWRRRREQGRVQLCLRASDSSTTAQINIGQRTI
jgi:hypothetical protein